MRESDVLAEIMKDSEIVRRWIDEGKKEGIEKGIEQGIKKGIEKGILKMAREAVLDALEIRFGLVSPSVLKAIMVIEEPFLLKSLHKKAMTAATVDEFKDHLKALAEE